MPTTRTKIVVDCSTGEQIEVALSDAEIADLDAQAAAWEIAQTQAAADAEAQAAAKASAEGKLKALGLSDAEIAALLN